MRSIHVAGLTVIGAAILLAGGCATTTTRTPETAARTAVPSARPDVMVYDELLEINATVTDDQKFVMNGDTFRISDIPKELAKRTSEQYVVIIVMPESKMTRQTLEKLVQTLVRHNYIVDINQKSKHADVPIPSRT